jgi:hypothetical protein
LEKSRVPARLPPDRDCTTAPDRQIVPHRQTRENRMLLRYVSDAHLHAHLGRPATYIPAVELISRSHNLNSPTIVFMFTLRYGGAE